MWSFFYKCKLFGLRGRDEYYDFDIFQFEIGEDVIGKFIQFVGCVNKIFKCGLKYCNVEYKKVLKILCYYR